MPAARGVKRAASKAEANPAAGSSKIKKKPEAKAPVVSCEDLKGPTRKGEVFTTGQGDVGQLGLGEDHLEKTKFTHVKDLPSNIVEICAGGMHTVAVDKDGNVWTFGCNDEGALGRPTEAAGSEWVPTKVELPGKVVSVSAGDSHSAALLHTAQVFAWGSFRDSHGNMGLTLKGNERKPVEMLPGHKVVQIASGGDHLVMLTNTGQVFTCGCGEQGQLGRVTARSCDRHSRLGLNGLLVPAPLVFCRDKADFEAIWAGSHCTFARKAHKGDIYVWGLNNYQQIGVRKGNPQTVFAPVISEAFATALDSDRKWDCISGGPHHTLALDDAGQCYTLGRREYGRLGLGEGCEDAKELTPVPALKDKKCVSISCGSAASFAVTDKGEVIVWGMGSSGQLGTGGEGDEEIPKHVHQGQLIGRECISVSAGGQHTVLLVASQDDAEDEIAEPQKGETAPQTKAEEETMEVDAEPQESKVVEEKKAGGRKVAGRRGRKPSTASNEGKPAAKKQNGGSPVPEEKETETTSKSEEPMDTANPPPNLPQEEGKLSAVEAGAEKRSTSVEPEEPHVKRAKLDDEADTSKPAATDSNTPVATDSSKPTATDTSKPATTDAVDPPPKVEKQTEMEVDDKETQQQQQQSPLANGNGDETGEDKAQEEEMTPPATEEHKTKDVKETAVPEEKSEATRGSEIETAAS